MAQLIAHGWGDYILQSHWMAVNKSKHSFPCLVHVLLYTACFLPLCPSWQALLVIAVSHYVIDRYPALVRTLIWWKNMLSPVDWYVPLAWCKLTGYYDPEVVPVNDRSLEVVEPVKRSGWQQFKIWLNTTYIDKDMKPRRFTEREEEWLRNSDKQSVRPVWLRVWLYIFTDNLLHITINYVALTWL